MSLLVYVQNAAFNVRQRCEGQTMAEYSLILGGIAILVILALIFLGGRIRDLFESTGSSVNTPVS
jgi:Flp pilus assembly pilin Flp